MTIRSEQTPPADSAPEPVEPADLAVILRRENHGPELAREPVLDGDLADARATQWRDGWLRKGQPGVPFEALSFRMVPRFLNGSGPRCESLLLEASDRSGQTFCRELAPEAFHDVATRGAQPLLEAGVLKPEDLYYYEVAVQRRPPAAADDVVPSFTVTSKNPPLAYLKVPLKPLLERAKAIGPVEDGEFPVIFTAEAVLEAERYARKGVDADPPAETGAVLIGSLCACPETRELFLVVCDTLEVRDAEGSSFSLSYTDKTWARIQAVMRAKQAEPATRTYRIVGQAHGHNFLPGRSCAECEKAKQCKLTTAFISADDRTWSRAVFSKQPWHVCLIFGLDARGERVHALYGLRDNRLVQRGFHAVRDFDPPRQAIENTGLDRE